MVGGKTGGLARVLGFLARARVLVPFSLARTRARRCVLRSNLLPMSSLFLGLPMLVALLNLFLFAFALKPQKHTEQAHP